MKSIRRLCIFLVIWCLGASTIRVPVSTAATAESSRETDEELMIEVRKMFSSPYQEEDYFRTDRLLVSATGSQKPVHLAPSVATVITAGDIKKMGATTLEEILETVPGLHVYPSYGGIMSNYTVRGIQTVLNPQVLVLVDGVALTSPYAGRRIYGLRIPLNNVSRIEVVRGPGSAVHGADAFAGTINIITQDNFEIDGVKSGLRYGSFDTLAAWGQYGGTNHGWDLALSFDYQEGEGDKDRIVDMDLQSTLDTLLGTTSSLAPGPLQTAYQNLDARMILRRNNWSIRLWGSLGNDVGVGSGAASVLDNRGGMDYRLLLCDLLYERDNLFRDWAMNVRISYLYQYSDTTFQLFPPGSIIGLDADGNAAAAAASTRYLAYYNEGMFGEPILTDTVPAIDFEFFYKGVAKHQVRLGLGGKTQDEDPETRSNFGSAALDLDSFALPPALNQIGGALTHIDDGPSAFLNDQHRDIWYVSVQDEWAFARGWEFTGGIRYDSYSDFGSTVNPRFALVWEARYNLTSKAMYGRAFRPPSFAELGNKNNPSLLGNLNLKPETIDTYELSLDYQPSSHWRFITNVFYYDIQNLIDYIADAGASSKTAQNAKNQEGYGFELEAHWKPVERFELSGNFSFQRSKNKDTGEIVPDAPGMQLYLNAYWEFWANWSLNGQYFHVADRHRGEGDTRADIKDNDLVHLTLRRKNIAQHWDTTLAVRNIFNENILEPAAQVIPHDYPMEGRSVWAELQYNF